jgi:dTDP-4-amino-4,6-dideoxygalactose transaminase
MKNMKIEYENLKKSNQALFPEFKDKFKEILESGRYVLGENVLDFERQFSKYTNTNFCCGVASGLDALTIALRSFDLPLGSEIIVPSNTYIATILSIVQNGLIPILVEPDIGTYNIDPTLIESHITKNTRAIIVVHLYGKLCNMDSIVHLSKRYEIPIIEDCAQAHGAMYRGGVAGSFGDFGAHSFYPTKNLGALGDAGALTTNDGSLDRKVRSLRNYGSNVKYVNEYVGYNSRLDELQAGFLLIKLKYLDDIILHKRKLAQLYLENIDPVFIKPIVHRDFYDVYHIFNIRHPRRDDLKDYLERNNIGTEIHYPIPPHKQKAMKGIIKGDYPISDEIHNTTLSLPISYFHTESDICKVIDTLNKFEKI